ncbi:flagellar motor protein MotB [Acidisphaera sp. L21]|uniref:flagellar motor protein MotB n=1 Tax=Acidisphaera sp. L21 TaxID=1641851 RepID=UPI00131CD8AD|nr:flagellar motor protein MotB [Acidisphaera sp. L21]
MAGKDDKKAGGKRPIIIRREEVVEGGHHGGAWKVAYADFVTAMMAFFLLMWLLNATTSEQKRGLADYFSPTNEMSRSFSGNGAIFGGHTPNDEGTMASDRGVLSVMNEQTKPSLDIDEDDSDTPSEAASLANGPLGKDTRRSVQHVGGQAAKDTPKPGDQVSPASAAGPVNKNEAELRAEVAQKEKSSFDPATGTGPSPTKSEAQLRAELAQKERASFDQAAKQIRDMVAADPALADLGRQLAVDITREGLRIQILDEDKQAMFPSGSAVLNDRARALLMKVAPVLMKLPERLSITGHTDSTPYKGNDRTNWELSTERANATRRLLAEAGIPEARVETVSGRADKDPLLPADPTAAVNRRIAIVVLRDANRKSGA